MRSPQEIKNSKGDALGYGRCPITRDTFLEADTIGVRYSQYYGVLISRRALNEFTPEQIAEVALQHARSREGNVAHNILPLDEIARNVRERKFM